MRYALLCAVWIFGAVLLNPPESNGCGPFFPEAQFTFLYNPGPEFLRGELGILRPQYFRRNLVVAYRYLSGEPLTQEEITALETEPASAVQATPGLQPGGPEAVAQWLAARNAVPGVTPIQRIEVYRHVLMNGYYGAYQNCLDDAFASAAATLAKRIAQWDEKSPNVAEWIRGQDATFANCGGGDPLPGMPKPPANATPAAPPVPAQLPADADPLLLADRQYQIAAAAFYAGRFEDAETGFRAVAANAASPWREGASYLTARALIRKGTVNNRQESLVSAEALLRKIPADPAQKRWHAPAQDLLDFVRARLEPAERMVELGNALSKSGLGSRISQAMTDYTVLWDRQNKGPVERSDLADWITAFQQTNGARALERWRQGGGTVWLVAAVAAARPQDTAAAELIAEARKIQAKDPAFATAAYHGVSLLIARNQPDEARQWADEALSSDLQPGARNSFLELRMRLARDWAEFLRYAPRSPVATTAVVADEPIAQYADMASTEPTFANDATTAWNHRIPLELWMNASSNDLLPRRLQTEITQAGWVRAVLLGRTAEARTLAGRLAERKPELAEGMRGYLAEAVPDAARFAAVLFMLRNPGLAPEIRGGFGRREKTEKLDNFRDNWWRLGSPTEGTPVQSSDRPAEAGASDFLSAAEHSAGQKESQTLAATAATAPNFLSAETMAWADTHPQDPRVPEALHLAVRATRFGITDAATTAYSKKAYQLLHSRYPQSQWARMTKYWY